MAGALESDQLVWVAARATGQQCVGLRAIRPQLLTARAQDQPELHEIQCKTAAFMLGLSSCFIWAAECDDSKADLLHDPFAITQKGVWLDARLISHAKGLDAVHQPSF
jgi:hypothetical protein